MADTKLPYAQPGVAAFELSDAYLNQTLLRGSDPSLSPAVSAVASGAIPRFAVVGFDADGKIALATADKTVRAIGITDTASAAEDERILYWYTGHFNSDILVWDASFATQADKDTAFDGAPTPVLIRITKRFD